MAENRWATGDVTPISGVMGADLCITDRDPPHWIYWLDIFEKIQVDLSLYECFLKWWYPQNTPKWSFLVGKPMVVGYHHFRKPPYWSSKEETWVSQKCSQHTCDSCVKYPNVRVFFVLKHCATDRWSVSSQLCHIHCPCSIHTAQNIQQTMKQWFHEFSMYVMKTLKHYTPWN